MLLASISTDSDEIIDTLLGWTPIDQGTSNGDVTLAVFYRIATALEPTSYTFTWGSNEQAAGAILRYSGVSTSNPIGVLAAVVGNDAVPIPHDQARTPSDHERGSDSSFPSGATLCSKCYTKALVLMDGCMTCLSCSDSKCG